MSLGTFFQLLHRFRYPVSLPEEIAQALGIHLTNKMSFDEFVKSISSPECRATTLTKFMPRHEAEKVFETACRKEQFRENSLYSYYFNEGWVEFVLTFDNEARLRRLYLQHKQIPDRDGKEIRLS